MASTGKQAQESCFSLQAYTACSAKIAWKRVTDPLPMQSLRYERRKPMAPFYEAILTLRCHKCYSLSLAYDGRSVEIALETGPSDPFPKRSPRYDLHSRSNVANRTQNLYEMYWVKKISMIAVIYPNLTRSCPKLLKCLLVHQQVFPARLVSNGRARVPELIPCLDVKDAQFDGVVLATDSVSKLTGNLECLKAPLEKYRQVDSSLEKDVVLVQTDVVPSGRLIFSPTGPLDRDEDDVRRFADAAVKGIQRALKAGCKCPLFVRPIDDSFPRAGLVGAMGALHALYVPIEIREDVPSKSQKAQKLGLWCNDEARIKAGIVIDNAFERGRIVTRDIGGSDPERMAAPNVAKYVQEVFKDTCIKVNVLSDKAVFEKEYPLMAAVNRSASFVERHQGRLIYLDYEGEGDIQKTLFLVGKGITYDTGGADIKAGGVMAGMHRDKCGAAAVAGFFKILSELKPKGLRVHGAMVMVRNSVGSECYVADEIITSRAGVRVRVGNTDAEGRMVMTDVLCKFKEDAVNAVNPHLFTIATLTGHSIRAMGPNYSIIMDNGPARQLKTAQEIQEKGDVFGDPFEISTIRRDDFDFNKGKSEYEDVLQCNNAPSSATARGHQIPAAFMIVASGMDKHGKNSDKPLPYSHMDIAGSSGPFPGVPTAAPVVALAATYILPRR